MAKSPSHPRARGPAQRPSGVRKRNPIAKDRRPISKGWPAHLAATATGPRGAASAVIGSGKSGPQRQPTVNHAPPLVAERVAGIVKVLILEAVPADADLVEHALREGGFACTVKRVDRRKPYVQALKAFAPEVAPVVRTVWRLG